MRQPPPLSPSVRGTGGGRLNDELRSNVGMRSYDTLYSKEKEVSKDEEDHRSEVRSQKL